ncbi:MAG: hypothetical protein ACW992_07310, partial [Candidatus Thorarchaeota archaeon]
MKRGPSEESTKKTTTPPELTTPNLTDLVSCVQLTGASWSRSENPSLRAHFGFLRGLGGVCLGCCQDTLYWSRQYLIWEVSVWESAIRSDTRAERGAS